MPNLNGLELAEKIRKMHRDIGVIVTGYPEYLTEDEQGEFLDYMTKPVDVKKLYDTIVKALDIPADRINGLQRRFLDPAGRSRGSRLFDSNGFGSSRSLIGIQLQVCNKEAIERCRRNCWKNRKAPLPDSVREGKYLTFSLAGKEYGIGILKVKEIIGMMSVTHVPRPRILSRGSSTCGAR